MGKRPQARKAAKRGGAGRRKAAKRRGAPILPAPKPLVCFVTPTNGNEGTNKSYAEFKHELMINLGWNGLIDLVPYAANDVPAQVQIQAHQAVSDAQTTLNINGQRAVIVAGGTSAATWAQYYAIQSGLTNALPIIQAVGGAVPPNAQGNVTGFVIDAATTSQQHFERLAKLSANPITVLYDATNPPSNYAYQALLAYQSYYFSGVQLIGISFQQLNTIQGAFMLIPNATYYSNRGAIATAVQNANVQAIYPEREYRKAHGQGHRAGKFVHGHSVGLTYRLAASYVDSILDGLLPVANLPPFKEAIIDRDSP